MTAVLRVHGRRPQCSSPQCMSPPATVFLLMRRLVVAQCVERLQHFNSAAVLNFNAAVPFPSGACGSLGCHSVAAPPRGRLWRLSLLVVQGRISMSARSSWTMLPSPLSALMTVMTCLRTMSARSRDRIFTNFEENLSLFVKIFLY